MLLPLLLDTKIAKNVQKQHIKLFFCPKGKKSLGRSPPQELEVGPRSGPYFLVGVTGQLKYTQWWYNTWLSTTSHGIMANTVTNHPNHLKVPPMAVQFNFFSFNFLFRRYIDNLLSLCVHVSLGFFYCSHPKLYKWGYIADHCKMQDHMGLMLAVPTLHPCFSASCVLVSMFLGVLVKYACVMWV